MPAAVSLPLLPRRVQTFVMIAEVCMYVVIVNELAHDAHRG